MQDHEAPTIRPSINRVVIIIINGIDKIIIIFNLTSANLAENLKTCFIIVFNFFSLCTKYRMLLNQVLEQAINPFA